MFLLQADYMRARREGSGDGPEELADRVRVPFNFDLDTAPAVEDVSPQPL